MRDSFIIKVWHHTLAFLEKISLFYLLRTFLPSLKKEGVDRFPRLKTYLAGNYFIVDAWVVFNNFLAFAFVFFAQMSIPIWINYILLVYGGLRVFEIFIYQLNIIFVHPYRGGTQKYELESYRRMTIMLIHNFFEIVFWFAGTYILLQVMNDKNSLAITKSFLQMITYDANIAGNKPTTIALIILQLQAIIGAFMTVLSLARFSSLFPKPNTKDDSEKTKQDYTEEQLNMLLEKVDKLEKELKKTTTY